MKKKPCLLLISLLTVLNCQAQQTNVTPTDSLEWVTGKLAVIVYYVKQAQYHPADMLDSLQEDANTLAGVITRNWLLCNTNDSHKLDSILAIANRHEQRKALLHWKYVQTGIELNGLLECCNEIQRACFTLAHEMKGDGLFGNKPEYESMAITAEDNFMQYQNRLHSVLDTHRKSLTPATK